jgi:hypothetical protein
MKPSSARRGWAIGIVGVFVLFVLGILALVLMAMSREVDLVTDQYYDRELRYQDRIQAMERASKPENAIEVQEKMDSLVLVYPPAPTGRKVTGNCMLYRPDNPRLDRVVPMTPNEIGRQVVPTAGLMPGLWRVKMEWKVGGVEYYQEKMVVMR